MYPNDLLCIQPAFRIIFLWYGIYYVLPYRVGLFRRHWENMQLFKWKWRNSENVEKYRMDWLV